MSDLDTAVRLLEEALHLLVNGERAPGGDETWSDWGRKTEAFLRAAVRREVETRLWVARCELSPEVMRDMDDEALLAHLQHAHPEREADTGTC